MQLSITKKLFLAILAAASLAVISMVLIMQWSLDRGFLRFVNTTEKTSVSLLSQRLEENYSHEHNWDFVRNDPLRWRQLVIAALPEEGPPPPDCLKNGMAPPPRSLPPPIVRHFTHRLFLLDADRKPLVAQSPVPADSEATPLRYDGRIVGYLGLLPRTNISDDHQKRFLREQRRAYVLVASLIVLLSAGLSLLLAKRLVRPVGELARATDRLAEGDFPIRVPVTANDELGRLAQDFNTLASVLARNEQARRQWVADISHELRTPLAILRGEIEALQDGIRQPTRENIHSLHGEVLRLGRLVDDLYQLSLSDVGALTYRKTPLDLAQVLTETVEGYRGEFLAKEIALAPEIPEKGGATVFGDPERLHQLFANLLDNALKYTDGGGRLEIGLLRHDNMVTVDFRDSAPGVPPADLDRLFDRLYRVESSRNRSTGGAGLGLAICRSIVEAHGGSITAQASPLGGLWISVRLPGADT